MFIHAKSIRNVSFHGDFMIRIAETELQREGVAKGNERVMVTIVLRQQHQIMFLTKDGQHKNGYTQ